MPAQVYPNLGLKAGYEPGEDGWGDDMTANVMKLSVLCQGGVNAQVAALPADAVDGDVYIRTDTQAVAARITGAWTEYVPAEGWLLYDRATDAYVKFDGAAWVVLATGGGDPGGGGEGNTEPYGKHRYWQVQVLQTDAGNYTQIAGLSFRSTPGGLGIPITGTASASGSYDGQSGPGNAFDGNPATRWESQSNTVSNGGTWIRFVYDEPVSVVEVAFTTHVDYETDERPRAGNIRYSDDGVTWVTAWPFGVFDYSVGGLNKITTSPDYEAGGAPSYITDAPSDGKTYGRKDANWSEIVSGGGGGSDPGFLPPVAADFPIVFSPSDFVSTLADKPVGLSVRCPPGLDGNRVPSFTHVVPNADWNIVAKVKGFMPIRGQATTGSGICVKSGNNTMLALMYEGVQIVVRQYRAGLYFDGVRYSLGVQGHDQYLKIARIGTSLFFYVSGDGESWVQIWTETIANWLGTAAEAGIMAIAGNVGPAMNPVCDYYKKTV